MRSWNRLPPGFRGLAHVGQQLLLISQVQPQASSIPLEARLTLSLPRFWGLVHIGQQLHEVPAQGWHRVGRVAGRHPPDGGNCGGSNLSHLIV